MEDRTTNEMEAQPADGVVNLAGRYGRRADSILKVRFSVAQCLAGFDLQQSFAVIATALAQFKESVTELYYQGLDAFCWITMNNM
jgi:hypothetical protein